MTDPKSEALIQEFYQWRWYKVCEWMAKEMTDLVKTARGYQKALEDADARVNRAFVNGFLAGVGLMFCVAMLTVSH